jgi:hypothetical protein
MTNLDFTLIIMGAIALLVIIPNLIKKKRNKPNKQLKAG